SVSVRRSTFGVLRSGSTFDVRRSTERRTSNAERRTTNEERRTVLLLRRCGRLIDAHAEAQPHRVQDFLDLVQALAPEVLGLEHLGFGLVHQLANRADVRVLEAVVRPDRELELFDALVEILVGRAG